MMETEFLSCQATRAHRFYQFVMGFSWEFVFLGEVSGVSLPGDGLKEMEGKRGG